MSKVVYITESQLMRLREIRDEVTFYKFFTEVKNFLQDLLKNPMSADISDFLKEHGVSKQDLLDRMLERGLISKKENIDEPYDAGGNKKSMHTLQYKVPKSGFEDKMHRLYTYFFDR